MHSSKRLWTPEASARKHLKLGPNTILATTRHGCSILTATTSRSFIKAKPGLLLCYCVHLDGLSGAETPLFRLDIGFDLLRTRRTGDHAADVRVAQQPRNAQLEHGVALALGI